MAFLTVAIEGPDDYMKTGLAKAICEATGALYWKYPYEAEFAGQECRSQLNNGIKDAAGFQALQTLNRYLSLTELFKQADKKSLVILDRWTLSSLVYGSSDGLPITWLNRLVRMLPNPDLIIRITGKAYGQKQDAYTEKQAEIVDKYNRLSQLIDAPIITVSNLDGFDAMYTVVMAILGNMDYIDRFDDTINYGNTDLITCDTNFERWALKHSLRDGWL